MPQGGLSMFGAGLQLQQATPGVANTGNAHLTGTLIADTEIYSENATKKLLKYGTNPGTNYNGAFGNGPANVKSSIIGDSNVILDSNVIQESLFIGNRNACGTATRTGITHWVVFGSNNAICNAGANIGSTGAVIVGNSNSVNFDLTHDGQNNSLPIVIGYANAWNGVQGVSAYSHGVVIDHGATVQSNLDNVVLIHGSRDGAVIASNTIRIGNSLQKSVTIGSFNLASGFSQNLFTQISSVTIANSAAEATLLGAVVGTKTIPANKLIVGSTIRIKARGHIGENGTPTLRLQFKIGGVAFLDTGAVAIPAFAGNHGWEWEGLVTVRTIGVGGTAIGQGIGFIAVVNQPDLDTTNSATTAINTTVTNIVDFTATFGAADPLSKITCTNATLEILG